jgi:RNA polymerase-binding transcription factor DksA
MPRTRKSTAKKKTTASPKRKSAKTSKKEQNLTAKELKQYEKILLEVREREKNQLDQIQEDLERTQVDSSHDLSAFPFHRADLGTDTAAREKNSILVTVEGDILYEIDQALRKIYDKSYGFCENCSKMISKKRLEAVPYARLCITCQEIIEKEKSE